MEKVEIFTDGACSGNPGPGGWGAVIRVNGVDTELAGGERDTTNNRMELTAVIEALRWLGKPCEVTVTTDSQYIVNAVNKGWIKNWKRQNWRRSGNAEVKNVDLLEALLEQLERHRVTFVWVHGHAGHMENERCDRIAVGQIAKMRFIKG